MVEVEGVRNEFVTIRRADIEAETDTETLIQLFQRLDEEALTLSEFLRAYREAEVDDEDYFERTAGKLAYIRIGTRWVERRILALGEVPPYPPNDPPARQLRLLSEAQEKLKLRVAQLERAA